jgi:hypothetical protein
MSALNLIARTLARPSVADWLIQRAMRTPFTHITSADGNEVYMYRYWLFNPYPSKNDGAGKRWGDWLPSIRIHRIMREDRDRHMHDHPWDARTFILCGWYREIRPRAANCPAGPGEYFVKREAGDTAQLDFGQYHRITQVSYGGVWTLFITWRKRGTWGFMVDGRKVPWREYLGIGKDSQ